MPWCAVSPRGGRSPHDRRQRISVDGHPVRNAVGFVALEIEARAVRERAPCRQMIAVFDFEPAGALQRANAQRHIATAEVDFGGDRKLPFRRRQQRKAPLPAFFVLLLDSEIVPAEDKLGVIDIGIRGLIAQRLGAAVDVEHIDAPLVLGGDEPERGADAGVQHALGVGDGKNPLFPRFKRGAGRKARKRRMVAARKSALQEIRVRRRQGGKARRRRVPGQ